MVPATRRSKVPPIPAGAGVLASLYGDVLPEWMQYTALAGMLAGSGQAKTEQQAAVVHDAMATVLTPGTLDQLAGLAAAIPVTGDERGIGRMAGVAAEELPKFMAMLSLGMDDLRRLRDAAARRPMTEEEFLFTLLDLVNARRHPIDKQAAGLRRNDAKTARRRPSASSVSVTRKVDSSGYVCFAGSHYRAGSAYRRRQVQVAVVGDMVEISIGTELIRTYPVKHDRTREHGAPGQPRR